MPKITKHPGVILLLKDGRHLARWRDPQTRKLVQQSLDSLGLTAEPARVRWAIAKAKELATIRAAVASSGSAAAMPLPLAEAVEKFIAAERRSPLTVKQYRVTFGHFIYFIAREGVSTTQEITPPALLRYRDHVTGDERGAWWKRTTVSRVQTLVRWLVRRGYVPRVTRDAVADNLERPTVDADVVWLPPKEVQKLLAACLEHDGSAIPHKHPFAPLALLAVLTGMRHAELAGLLWPEVDLEARTITLPAKRCKGGKRGRVIRLRVCPTAVELLRVLSLRAGGNARVFPNVTEATIECATKRLRKDYGVSEDFTLHALRRTAATVLTNAERMGAGPWFSCQQLGHTMDVAVKHYIGRLDVNPKHETMEQVLGIERIAGRIISTAGGKLLGDATEAAAVG